MIILEALRKPGVSAAESRVTSSTSALIDFSAMPTLSTAHFAEVTTIPLVIALKKVIPIFILSNLYSIGKKK